MKGFFAHWTTTKAAIAAAGLLAIGGAVGSAVAVSPINAGPSIKWAGGWEIETVIYSNQDAKVYVVPAGRNLMVTDILASNFTAEDAALQMFITGAQPCSGGGNYRIRYAAVKASDNFQWSPQTGIGFASGQSVCLVSSQNLNVVLRGYLFTPQPTS